MKILHISVYPQKNSRHVNDSGVASYTKNLVLNTPYLKEDKVYIVCNKLNNKSEKYSEDGFTVLRTFDRDIRFLFQILKEVYSIKPDIIHIQQELSLYGNIITSYLLQWLVILISTYNTLITIHGVVSIKDIDKDFIKENNYKLPIWLVKLSLYVIYRPLCIFSKGIIVHEQVFKDRLVREYKINQNKIQVIPHGIEDFTAIDQQKALQHLDLPTNKKISLFMGYLAGYKGIDLLIEGFAEYIKQDPKAYIVIGAGKHPKLKDDANYLSEYKRIKHKAQNILGDNHKWVGFIEEKDIKYYYSAADVSIYPYTNQLSSSGPMSIAIGFEKPFLASEVFDNFIENKEILFNKNPNSLKDTLTKFFDNKENFVKDVKILKKERLWSLVGIEVYGYYKSLI